MCISAGKGRIMCRIDPDVHESALKREGCRTVIMKGRQYRGYVYVDADALKAQSSLDYWINLSLEYNGKSTKALGSGDRDASGDRPCSFTRHARD